MRYRVYLQVVRAHLTVALRLGAIEAKTAIAMIDEMRIVGTHHRTPGDAILPIADYQLAMEESKVSNMDTLSRDFADPTVSQIGDGSNGNLSKTLLSHENGTGPTKSDWLETILG
jgi:hypothetical protein